MIKASIRSKGEYAYVKVRSHNANEVELIALAAKLAATAADECYGGDVEKAAEKIKGVIGTMADYDD